MKKYFTRRNNKKEGPYTIEELVNNGISEFDLIMSNDSKSWIEAIEIDELSSYFELKRMVSSQKKGKYSKQKPNKFYAPIKISIIIALLFGIIPIVGGLLSKESITFKKLKEKFELESYQRNIQDKLSEIKSHITQNTLDYYKKLEQACPETPRNKSDWNDRDLRDSFRTVESYAKLKRSEGKVLSYYEKNLVDKYDICVKKFNKYNQNSNSIYHPQLDDIEIVFGRGFNINETEDYTDRLIKGCNYKIDKIRSKTLDNFLTEFFIVFILSYVVLFLVQRKRNKHIRSNENKS